MNCDKPLLQSGSLNPMGVTGSRDGSANGAPTGFGTSLAMKGFARCMKELR
jgi:hypothetical protein